MTPMRFALAAAVALGFGAAHAEDAAPSPSASPDRFSVEQLMAPGPLPDIVQGDAAAPVTIIEYASMTCTHCAAFHEQTWPTLKAKYVDAGKANFILREFPLDPLATVAFMLERCLGPQKRDALADALFTQQKTWAFVDKPKEALSAVATTFGLSSEQFESCVNDQKLFEAVKKTRDDAAKAFKIDSTPTFFINGQKLTGALPLEAFEAAIDAQLK